MQSLDIYLTRKYISFHSSELTIDKTIEVDEAPGRDSLKYLFQSLAELNLPKNTSLNLIMDQTYIGYFSFNLPSVNRRKLNRILKFELADFLIDDIDEVFFDYRYRLKKDAETMVGVYLIRKEMVNRILQLSKSQNLEIKNILPLNDLIDLRLQEKYRPVDEIIAIAEPFQSGIYIYQNGFLISSASQATGPSDRVQEKPERKTPGSLKLNDLNRRIKAINLDRKEITHITIDDESSSFIELTGDMELSATENHGKNEKQPIYALWHLHSARRSNRINLLKSDFFILQEIGKHTKKIAASGVLLLLCCLILLSSLLYETYVQKERLREIEKAYSDAIQEYLPRGTPKANALQILRNEVQKLKEDQILKQRFDRRKYRISSQLASLSKIKESLPNLILNRFYQTEQSIRVQGEIDSFTQYDKLKQNLQEIYNPGQFDIKYNQKSSGEAKVQFSIIVRSIK